MQLCSSLATDSLRENASLLAAVESYSFLSGNVALSNCALLVMRLATCIAAGSSIDKPLQAKGKLMLRSYSRKGRIPWEERSNDTCCGNGRIETC